MNKSELIQAVAKQEGVTLTKSSQIINGALNAIINTLTKGEEVGIVGFGAFKVRRCDARIGRNPHTGEALEIPAQNKVVFVPGKSFKQAVNETIQ